MNIEQKELARKLLILAKGGDKLAEFDFLELIRTYEMPRRVGRYISKNRQVDNDDIRQEFMIGVALSMADVNMEIGDPLQFIMSRGIYRVRSYMRKFIIQGTIQVCGDCGNKSRLNRIDNQYVCKKCGSTNVTTAELNDNNEIALESAQVDGFEADVISQMMVDEFKQTLTPGTNVYNLYELLINGGMDRDNPLVKNYIKEIARMWGGCSTQNVSTNMDKLKVRLKKYMESNGDFNMNMATAH